MGRLRLFLTGWSDFFMTIAEVCLPAFGLYRLARYVAEKHYVGGLHGPGAKEIALARIYEEAGDLKRAEECLNRAVTMRPDAYQVFLAQFFARTGQRGAAIDAFERARGVTHHAAELEFIQQRIAELRRSEGDAHP